MLIVHVHIKVKPDRLKEFVQATIENAKASRKEEGIARFDLLQEQDDPTKFILVEEYRTPEAPAAHKETPHYHKWRDTVADLIAQPRHSVKLVNLEPPEFVV